MTKKNLALMASALCIAFASHAQAVLLTDTVPGVTFPTNPRTGIGVAQPEGRTIGWSFSLDAPRTATHLGMYNYNFSGGSSNPREIGLWDMAGTLVASLTLPPNGGELDGPAPLNFIYGELSAPIDLVAGETYTLGVLYNIDNSPGLAYNLDVTTMSGLTIETFSLAGPGGGLNRPTGNNSVNFPNGFFGPNIRFLPASDNAVPEPASAMLALMGLGGLMIRRRRAA